MSEHEVEQDKVRHAALIVGGTGATTPSPADRIRDAVASWPGVHVEAYGRGMLFFHVGKREIGHLHGSRLADLPFPVRIRERLVAEGKADLHYLHPKTGWVTYYIRGEQDVEPIIELFRFNYGRPWLAPEHKTSA